MTIDIYMFASICLLFKIMERRGICMEAIIYEWPHPSKVKQLSLN